VKKVFSITFLSFLTTIYFAEAQSGDRRSFDLGPASPYFVEFSEVESIKGRTNTATVAANASFLVLDDNRKFGFGIYFNFTYPFDISFTPEGGKTVPIMEDYVSLSHISVLLGPAFMLYKSGRFSLPVTFGVHWMLFSKKLDEEDSFTFNNFIGLGANISAEHHFNSFNRIDGRDISLYLFGRFQLTVDLFAFKDSYTGPIVGLGFNPAIGVGLKY
jgi:hypothetical protein